MAEFGIKATGMSAPDTGAAKFVRQPTADQSGNFKLGFALDMAKEAYTGYQQASLEKAQESVINEYIQSKQNPEIAAQAQVNIGALDSASESLWNRAQSDPNYQPDVNDFSGIEKSLAEQLNKYKAAKDQGVMSPQEFSDRILATTRAAVAQNPGLYNELIQHSTRMLELSGIKDVVKADLKSQEDQAKAQSKMEDYYLGLGKQLNVPVPYLSDGSTDWGSFVGQIQKIQHQNQLVTLAENTGKLDTEQAKAQGRAFMAHNGIDLMNGKLNNVLYQGISLLNAGGDYQGAITQIRLGLNQAKQEYTAKLLPIANDPNVKTSLDYLDKQIQVYESLLTSAGTKEDAVKLSTNLNTLLRNNQYAEVSKVMNPESLKMLTSLLNTVGAPRMIDQNPEAMGNIMKTLGNVFSGAANGLGTDYSLNLGKDNAVSAGVAHLAQQAVKDPEAVSVLEKSLAAISQDVLNPDKFKTPADKFNFYEKLIRDLGRPEVKAGISKIGAAGYSQAATMIDDYMTMTTPAMQTSILKWEKQGVKVQLDTLPDGRAIFRSDNPEATRDLNSRYTSRINDSLQAMANLMGVDTKSAAVNTFYPTYLPAWNDNKNLTPVEIRSKSEADKALKEGKITQQEYDAIIQSGFKP